MSRKKEKAIINKVLRSASRKVLLGAISVLLVLFALHIALPEAFAAGVGTTGAQFLKIGVGARAVGMGSSFVAVADDVNTAYWNPSGFSQIEKIELTTMYLSWIEGINYGYIGYAHPCKGNLTVGGSLTYLTTGDIPGTNTVGETTGDYSGEDIAFSLSVGKKVTDNMSIGSNVKVIQQQIDNESASGYAFDVGTLYVINERSNVGMVVQNIGAKIKFVEQEDALPLNWKVGASHKLLRDDLTLAMDVNFPVDNKVTEHIGAEYMMSDAVAVRIGYKTDTITSLGTDSGFSAGFGLVVATYSMDYAWVPYGDLGQTHRLSFLMRF
ncbi:MAG: PorV/PorQ family protein [bacterium]